MKLHIFKPYQLAHLVVPTSIRRRLVEVISHPFSNDPDLPEDGIKEGAYDRIKVRAVPGEPTTMIEVELSQLHPCIQRRYIHVARVSSAFTFPEDMLRYDNAMLFDHTLPEDGFEDRGLPAGEYLVYTDHRAKTMNPWTVKRWESFSCTITPVLVRDLRNHTDHNSEKPKY